MALKIKKQIKQSDGTILEIEGTEAEVEAFERKNEKKQQSEQAKKERKLLLESKKTIEKMTKKELTDLIQKMLAAAPSRVEHHWHYDNGYWWRPWWNNGIWTYQYTLTNPTYVGHSQWATNTSGNSIMGSSVNSSIITCNSAADFSKTTGIKPAAIATTLTAAALNDGSVGNKITCGTITSTSATGSAMGVSTNGITLGNFAGQSSNMTSGIINMNIKS
jgi:hypothetical protein